MIEIQIQNQTFHLLPERAVFWKDTRTLILTDIHLGKSGHFRKSGIAVPQQVNETNLERMGNLVTSFMPERLFILGDLFHSDANREWFRFEEWRNNFDSLDFHLVAGNHDTLHASFYDSANVSAHPYYEETGFGFIHDPRKIVSDDSQFIFCGHVHPGVKLSGDGRQTLHLPCFYQTEQRMILPAFGEFTGLHMLGINKAVQLFAIADIKIVTLRNL
ncbi:ligase-associated DNA damage response endonuclease PdeM [soil metagenome]